MPANSGKFCIGEFGSTAEVFHPIPTQIQTTGPSVAWTRLGDKGEMGLQVCERS